MLVDSHCHLDFPDLAGRLPEVLARARQAGVVRMVTISTRVEIVTMRATPASRARASTSGKRPARSGKSRWQ